jgi:hypothetical protein
MQIDERHKNAKFSPCALRLEPYASLAPGFFDFGMQIEVF